MGSLADHISDIEKDAQIAELRNALALTQKRLARAQHKVEDLVAATVEASREAMLALGPLPKVTPPKGKPASREVMLVDTGDWQFSKVTPSYNSAVAEERVARFIDEAILLGRARGVGDVILVCGGDMVEGLFNFPTQPYEIDALLFEQYTRVGRLLVKITKALLAEFHTVTVVPEWGNHGRIGSKRDAVVRSDNVDRMSYELARQLLEDEPRLTWQECPEDIQRLEVGNYRALVIHGDEIGRNGFASPATIVQHVNRWRSGAYRVGGVPWEFTDVYMHHYHTHAEWPLANGEGSVYQTGSTESENRYAGISLAASAIPSQRVHFIDPVVGRVVAQHKVWLA